MTLHVTPECISSLKPNEIFVFGSNLAGMHGGGATLLFNGSSFPLQRGDCVIMQRSENAQVTDASRRHFQNDHDH